MFDSKREIERSKMMTTVEQAGQAISETALLRVAGGGAVVLLGMMLAKVFGFLRQFLTLISHIKSQRNHP